MALLQLGKDVRWREAAHGKKHERVKSEVGHFFDETLIFLCECGDDDLCAFLTNFLRNLRQALCKKTRGV
jgi:hypothetical protein